MQRDAMNAVADFSRWIRDVLRVQTLVNRLPVRAGVVAAKRTGGGDRHEHPVAILWIQEDGVQAHPAGARLPLRSGAVTAQSGEFVPALAAVTRAKQRCIFDAGVNRIRTPAATLGV